MTIVADCLLVPLSNGVLLDVIVRRLERDARKDTEELVVAVTESLPVADTLPVTDVKLL